MTTTLEIKDSLVAESEEKPSAPTNPTTGSKTSFAAYSGPIPPPHFLVEYEKLLPGIAKKFLEEPHIEAEHRRSIEKMSVSEQVKLVKRGQDRAFSLALACVLIAFTAISLGHSLEGLGVFVSAIATFAYVFCYAKKQEKKQ